MGIPLYFRSVAKKYPTVIDANVPKCARLFLDLNCAIHQCANNVLALNQDVPSETIERQIVEHTIAYIETIASFVRPEDLMFIAIDGTPPCSKILQQRKRRFVGSWRQSILDTKRRESRSVFTQWDRNAITPGTEFMNRLAAELHAYFDDEHRFPFAVVLSDSNEEGEGEAKILDHIKDTDVPAHADVIYGLDADLIMLSMLSSKNNIYLLREPAQYELKTQVPFMFLDIQQLRRYVSVECSHTETYDENVVWDYVVLCFLQGNDFMPALSFLKIRHNGIELVLQIYTDVREELGQHLVVKEQDGFVLNYMFLLRILERLKTIEDKQFVDADAQYYANHTLPFVPGKRTPAERLSHELDHHPTIHKFARIIRPEIPGWRLRYYHYLFTQTTEIQEINDICLNYVQGIQWTFDYYFNRCTSRHWLYKYDYSPTALDLYNYLLILENAEAFVRDSIAKNFPAVKYDTHLQLLMCLPPSSKGLLHPRLRRVMEDLSLGCVHYYPQTFNITGYLKNYLWEAHPNLPLVDARTLCVVKNALLASP